MQSNSINIFPRVGMLDLASLFPADASSTSAGKSRVTESRSILVKRSYFCETEEVGNFTSDGPGIPSEIQANG